MFEVKLTKSFFIKSFIDCYPMDDNWMYTFVYIMLSNFYSTLFHELGHYYTSIYYNLNPGDIIIRGHLTGKCYNRQISMAGPFVNLILALIFYVYPFKSNGSQLIAYYEMNKNFTLYIINMVPIRPFDGYKIFKVRDTLYIVNMLVLGCVIYYMSVDSYTYICKQILIILLLSTIE